MIRRLPWLWLLCASVALAQDEPSDTSTDTAPAAEAGDATDTPTNDATEEAAPIDYDWDHPVDMIGPLEPIDQHRVRLDKLMERTIGTTAKPVAFEWRDSPAMFAVQGSQPVELNTFNTLRAGGMVRLPREPVVLEISAGYARTWDSRASSQLALTPYRQPGRPSRIWAEINVALPLAEGVITVRPRWFPALHMVFEGYAGLRYGFYPFSFDEMRLREKIGAVLSPGLNEQEVENLDERRLDAMQTDTGRYFTMLGLGNVFYMGSGLFVAPRVQVAVPLLAAASGTELKLWGDVSIAVGWAL